MQQKKIFEFNKNSTLQYKLWGWDPIIDRYGQNFILFEIFFYFSSIISTERTSIHNTTTSSSTSTGYTNDSTSALPKTSFSFIKDKFHPFRPKVHQLQNFFMKCHILVKNFVVSLLRKATKLFQKRKYFSTRSLKVIFGFQQFVKG